MAVTARLLDTSAYANLRRGEPEVVPIVRAASKLYLSTIVIGELHFGFNAGSQTQLNLHRLERFLARPNVEVIDVTETTARFYGRIIAGLRTRGRPIPTNDIWIAAHALEFDCELVSYDRHFTAVEELKLLHLVRT